MSRERSIFYIVEICYILTGREVLADLEITLCISLSTCDYIRAIQLLGSQSWSKCGQKKVQTIL